MANKVYVGNLPYTFTNEDLAQLFAAFGPVRSAEVILDRVTGRSRGFGFVEMETAQGMQDGIAGLHEKDVQGRNLTVNEARERTPRPARDGGARVGGGGGGGGFGSSNPRGFGGGSQRGSDGDGGRGGFQRDRGERGGGERDRGGRGGRRGEDDV